MNLFNDQGQDLRNKLDTLCDVYTKQTLDDAKTNLLLNIARNEQLLDTVVGDTEYETELKAVIQHLKSIYHIACTSELSAIYVTDSYLSPLVIWTYGCMCKNSNIAMPAIKDMTSKEPRIIDGLMEFILG